MTLEMHDDKQRCRRWSEGEVSVFLPLRAGLCTQTDSASGSKLGSQIIPSAHANISGS